VLDGSNFVLGGNLSGAEAGLVILGGNSTVSGLVIDHFTQGIDLLGSGEEVVGNLIGTDVSGASAAGGFEGIYSAAGSNTIGGSAPASRNIISGNSYGVYLEAGNGNVIEGNYVGTDKSGTVAVENAYGIIVGTSNNTVGGTAAGAGNLISGGPAQDGISVDGNNNLIQGNLIGTDDTGTFALGNGNGISIYGNNNTVGGTVGGAGNTIAYSLGTGVYVNSGTANNINGNSIFSNGDLGILLYSPNNANNTQAFPILTGASSSTSDTNITGTLQSAAGTSFRIEFFASAMPDPSSYGQGRTYLGSTTVMTDNSGIASISFDLGVGGLAHQWLSATATGPNGTSEFSADEPILAPNETLAHFLQAVVAQSSSTTNSLTIPVGATPGSINTVVAALAPSNLGQQVGPVSVYLNLTPGTYSQQTVQVPAGMTLYINGTPGTTIDPDQPAFTVTSGSVVVSNVTFSTTGDAPTILVTGGSLTLRNDVIQESSGYTDACISLTGGTLDLGTSASPGGNTLNINGTGRFIDNSTGISIPQVGDTFEVNGQVFSPYMVTTTADSGPGSLRDAINKINEDNAGTQYVGLHGVDEIDFNITGASDTAGGGTGYNSATGVATIKPLSALPEITNAVLIDGYTEPGASANTLTTGDNAVLKIVLDGSQVGAATDGLVIAGGKSTVRGLVIDDFAAGTALVLSDSGNDVVAGNFIGTDVKGESAAANQRGIDIYGGPGDTIGGTGVGAGNVISGNSLEGIRLFASQVVVAGNLIGTDATGKAALGNGYGIGISGDYNTIGGAVAGARNIVSANNGNGGSNIFIDGESGGGRYNLVEGNYVGTDITGTTALGDGYGIVVSGSFNTIGGTSAAARNLVSGNNWFNIAIYGPGNFQVAPSFAIPTGNVVEGNYVGTDVTGTRILPNARFGVELANGAYDNIIGGTVAGAGNLISGNALEGINIGEGYDLAPEGAKNNFVWGNLIGTDKTGSVVLGNGIGIDIDANDNAIGGTQAGAANLIKGNSLAGVEVETGTGNAILGNSIYANGMQGIELDVGYAPSGGNDLQAAPVVTAATISTAGTTISGSLASAAGTTFRIEFFSNQSPGPSGGDGQTYLGFATVSTDASGYLASSPGGSAVISNPDTANATFTVTGLMPVPAGQSYLAATATNLTTNDTSAFSGECALFALRVTNLGVSGSNGAPVTNTGTFSDGVAGTSVTLTASAGAVVQHSDGTWSWSETTPAGAAQTVPVTIYATDSYGQTAAADFWLNVGKVFVVTNTLDDGTTGSLRWAITQVNNDASDSPAQPDLIAFNINGPGLHNIVLGFSQTYANQPLPPVTQPVVIDGYTEPGSSPNTLPNEGIGAGDNGVWTVLLNGGLITSGNDDGLKVSAGDSIVQGLFIQGFSANGIHLMTNGNDQIAGNYLTWPLSQGILVDNVRNNTIGGTSPAARNVIGGGSGFRFGGAGLAIQGAGATGNQVQGNYIGFDGTRPLFTAFGGGQYAFYDWAGISISDASNNIAGGTAPGAGNVIAAQGFGIGIFGDSSSMQASGNLVQGNYIGTNPDGRTSLLTPGNIGIKVAGYANNNIIGGVDTNGPGAPLAGGGNVISGWQLWQILLGFDPSTDGNFVEGNYIGTNAAGTASLVSEQALPSANGDFVGIEIGGENSMISGNLISGCGVGIDFDTPGNQVQGNRIGTDATGTQAIPNGIGIRGYFEYPSGINQIGGTAPGEGNVIAFNDGPAVEVLGQGYAIEGNAIYGNNDINGHTGQPIDNLNQDQDSLTTLFEQNWPGGPFTGTDNSSFTGLTLSQSGTTLTYTGTLNGLPNTRYLVTLAAVSSVPAVRSPGNYLSNYWGSDYIYLTTDSSGTVSFTVNFPAPWGTSNSPGTPSAAEYIAHSLGNYEQNYPVLTSATSGTSSVVTGTLNGQPNTTFTVDLYVNPTVSASDYFQGQYYGQGHYYLGHATVTTDANGNASFSADFSAANLPGGILPAGWYISATSTDPGGNTSQFSADVISTTATTNVSQYLQAELPHSSSAPAVISIEGGPDQSPATVISAVNGLTNITQPVTIILDLGGGTYSTGGVAADPPPNVTFVVQNGTLDPAYPALTVTGGQVSVVHCTLTTSSNAPTLLVTGGSLTLRDDVIQESTGSNQAAISITGGTVDLGTAADPGGNTINVNGTGTLIRNTTANPVSAVGDTFEINGQVTALPIALTVTTNCSLMLVGNSPPPLTGTVNGASFTGSITYTTAFGDQVTVTLGTTATSASPVGQYAITATLSAPTPATTS
jgi:parallel beta-helix repeat protein